MPSKAKMLSYYPTAYREILKNVVQGGQEYLLDSPDRMRANKLRGQFYAYVGVLRREATAISVHADMRALSPHEQEIQELARLSSQLMISVEDCQDGTALLRFTTREQSWQAQMLAKIRPGRKLDAGLALTESGAVVPREEQSQVEIACMQLDSHDGSPGAMREGALDAIAAFYRGPGGRHILDRHPKLQDSLTRWEKARDLYDRPQDPMTARVADRMASYGIKPTGGSSK